MFLRIWQFLTIMLNALTMGLLFSHLLEMPQKMQYSAPLYLQVTHTLYHLFGSIGGPLEVSGLLFAIVLCFLVRSSPFDYVLTIAATALFAAALILWILYVAPANAQFASWTSESIPANWTRVRNQWEHTHAADASLVFAGVSLLVYTALNSRSHKESKSVRHNASELQKCAHSPTENGRSAAPASSANPLLPSRPPAATIRAREHSRYCDPR